MKILLVAILTISLILSVSACSSNVSDYAHSDREESGLNINKSSTTGIEANNNANKSSDIITAADEVNRTKEIFAMFSDKASKNQITKSYPQSDIISSMSFMAPFNASTRMYQLDKQFPIEYLAMPKNSPRYCVYNLNEGGELFVFFDFYDGGLQFVTHIFVVKNHLTKNDFEGIKNGMSLKDVESVDSGVKIINSINPTYLIYKQTLHMVDGGFVNIKYTGNNFDGKSFTYKDTNSYKVESVEFIPNGSLVSFPDEMSYDYVNGGCNYTVLDGDYIAD